MNVLRLGISDYVMFFSVVTPLSVTVTKCLRQLRIQVTKRPRFSSPSVVAAGASESGVHVEGKSHTCENRKP